MVKTDDGFGWQVWHANGATCPDGTIPIRRFEAGISHRKQHHNPLVSDAAARATKGHQVIFSVKVDALNFYNKITINITQFL